jgi:hypothetical protein
MHLHKHGKAVTTSSDAILLDVRELEIVADTKLYVIGLLSPLRVVVLSLHIENVQCHYYHIHSRRSRCLIVTLTAVTSHNSFSTFL